MSDALEQQGLAKYQKSKTLQPELQGPMLEDAIRDLHGALQLRQKVPVDALNVLTNNLAGVHKALGKLLMQQNKFSRAESEFLKAAEILNAAFGKHPAVAMCNHEAVQAQRAQGRLREAFFLSRASLEIFEASASGTEESTETHVAATLTNMGNIADQLGDVATAEEYLGRGVRALATLGSKTSSEQVRKDHATALLNLGIVLRKRGKIAESEARIQEAMGMLASESSAKAAGEGTAGTDNVDSARGDLSIVRLDLGIGKQSLLYARCLCSLAKCSSQQSQFKVAAQHLDEATQLLKARASAARAEKELLCTAVSDHGVAVWQAGDPKLAGELFQEALLLAKSVHGGINEKTGNAALKVGAIHVQLQQWAQAEAALEEAVTVLTEASGADHAQTKVARQNLALARAKKPQ